MLLLLYVCCKGKKRHFDYPWNQENISRSSTVLTDALLGKIDPEGNPLEDVPFLESGVTIEYVDGKETLVDPWGNPYLYLYDEPINADGSGGFWENAGFILISKGNDGLFDSKGIDQDGNLDLKQHNSDSDNADNLIYGYDSD